MSASRCRRGSRSAQTRRKLQPRCRRSGNRSPPPVPEPLHCARHRHARYLLLRSALAPGIPGSDRPFLSSFQATMTGQSSISPALPTAVRHACTKSFTLLSRNAILCMPISFAGAALARLHDGHQRDVPCLAITLSSWRIGVGRSVGFCLCAGRCRLKAGRIWCETGRWIGQTDCQPPPDDASGGATCVASTWSTRLRSTSTTSNSQSAQVKRSALRGIRPSEASTNPPTV